MAPNIITGNLLDVPSEAIPGPAILAHQTNTQGIAGAGLAKQIRNKWPAWFLHYWERAPYTLGTITGVRIAFHPTVFIVNLHAQATIGHSGVHTNYTALAQCLAELHKRHGPYPIYLPYGLGCGLAGGEWNIVFELICKYCPTATIVRLPERQPAHANLPTFA